MINKYIAIVTLLVAAISLSAPAQATVYYKDDCSMNISTPFYSRGKVYSSNSTSCTYEKDSMELRHSTQQNSRFWVWKTKASAYNYQTNLKRMTISGVYSCTGFTATKKWRGNGRSTIKDGSKTTDFYYKTSSNRTITCN